MHSAPEPLLLFALSAGLMFASPFFTSGRSSILPSITTPEELHVANTMTQTTSWASLTLGAFLGAAGANYGYRDRVRIQCAFVRYFRAVHLAAAASRRLPAAGAEKRPKTGFGAVSRRPELYERDAAAVRPGHGQRGLGQRRRRGADSVQPVRRESFSRRPAGNRRDLGIRRASGCSSAGRSATGWGSG